jgi:hypothetical protein
VDTPRCERDVLRQEEFSLTKMRAVLIGMVVTAGILSSTAIAEQESKTCGWVLWIKHNLITTEMERKEWEIQDASDTRTECLNLRHRVWLSKWAFWDRTGRNANNVATVSTVPDATVTVTFKTFGYSIETLYCLPSSVDPRPKLSQ